MIGSNTLLCWGYVVSVKMTSEIQVLSGLKDRCTEEKKTGGRSGGSEDVKLSFL